MCLKIHPRLGQHKQPSTRKEDDIDHVFEPKKKQSFGLNLIKRN